MDLNGYSNIDYLEAKTPDELRDLIRSIPFPIEILTIYGTKSGHIAWIRTHGKIRRIVKGENTNG